MKKILIIVLLSTIFMGCNKDSLDKPLADILYVKSNGNSMPAYIYGNGKDKVFMLLLHGGPGGNGIEYRDGLYAELLEKEFAVIYWDQRGQGMAQGKPDKADLNIELMAQDIEKLIAVIRYKYGKDSKIFLYGHSWGGMLGSAFIVNKDRQKLVSGWIESNGAHDLPFLNIETVKLFITIGNEQIAKNHSVAQWTDIVKWAKAIDTNNISSEISGELNSKAFEVEDLLGNDGELADSKPSDKLYFYSPINKITNFITGNKTNLLLNDEIEKTSFTPQIGNIAVPCLFMTSKFDFVVPPALAIDAFQRKVGMDKELKIFEFSGHSPMNGEAELYANTIINFIKKYK